MGSSCAWHQNGFHVALTFTSGDIAVVVSLLTLPPEALRLQWHVFYRYGRRLPTNMVQPFIF